MFDFGLGLCCELVYFQIIIIIISRYFTGVGGIQPASGRKIVGH